MSKIDKLKELGELLKSGTITNEEFENLKKEIFQHNIQNESDPKILELESLRNSGEISQSEFYIRKLRLKKSNVGTIKEIKQKPIQRKKPIKQPIKFKLERSTKKILIIGFLSISILLIFAKISGGNTTSSKKNNMNDKTSFNDCDEILNYVRYKSYSSLAAAWGKGTIGEPWDASAVGSGDMRVYVKWSNVKLRGKSVEILFKNGYGLTFDKKPNKLIYIECGSEGNRGWN